MFWIAAAWAATPLQVYEDNLERGEQPQLGALVVHGELAPAQLASWAPACRIERSFPHRAVHVLRCEGETRTALVALQEHLEWVAPPWYATLSAAEDDLDSLAWHHSNTGQSVYGQSGTLGADVGSVSAWSSWTGSPDYLVAVLDTGVFVEHQDLQNQIWRNPGELDCEDGLDDDGNGYRDDCQGWDFGDNDRDASPVGMSEACSPWHGTFISGLIAAEADNGVGIVGLAPQVRILPVKLPADLDCGVTDVSIAEAVDYALASGAGVINASWHVSATSPTLRKSIKDADRAGVILVIAAGNDGLDLDASGPDYPIAYELDHAIVVAATDNRDSLASWSNRGASWVHLGAPGSALTSLTMSSSTSTDYGWGTSYAAPLVTGAVALISSELPALHPDEVIASILAGVTEVEGLSGSTVTGGRLNVPGAQEQARAWMQVIELELESVEVQDSDGDGLAEVDEPLAVRLQLHNLGHATATGLVGHVSLDDEDAARVLDDSALAWADLGDDESGAASFLIQVAPGCEEDLALPLTLTLEGDEALTFALELPLTCRWDEDEDGWPDDEDCDDQDAAVHPGAEEHCDGLDEDCDEQVDEQPVDAPGRTADCDGVPVDSEQGLLDSDGPERPEPPPEGCERGCSSAPVPGLWALLGLLALTRRYGRRNPGP